MTRVLLAIAAEHLSDLTPFALGPTICKMHHVHKSLQCLRAYNFNCYRFHRVRLSSHQSSFVGLLSTNTFLRNVSQGCSVSPVLSSSPTHQRFFRLMELSMCSEKVSRFRPDFLLPRLIASSTTDAINAVSLKMHCVVCHICLW